VFISERFNVKEAATLTGAAAAVSEEVGIATGVTNTPTRHPLVTAAWAMTMHKLTRGRFALGIGRGIGPLTDIMGIPKVTMAQMEDAIGIYRRLWRGEPVFGHDGPAGRYPLLTMGSDLDEHIPVMAACLGFRTMRWAGRVTDGVILHTFVTDEALARCVAEVRAGAEEAGRDPASVKVWAVLATLHEPDDERRLRGITGRMATYFQAYGDALVAMNGWDPAPLERFRQDPVVQSVPGAIDAVATTEQLEHIATLIPEDWLPAAVGSAEVCAARAVDQLEAGADGVILHGSAPAELEPVVDAYRRSRPVGRFEDRPANPAG
jgi:probable F420-dependent oxidoreductase